ncbi:hypothetical protein HMN09_00362700 [Mycena chlorophos]|uniref:Uncharacterized protein n=1 Tax=Mycena chlorophos TaxID=658473 RepID=A0A8H6WI57_MYCCL|nr:hypothetical protein HMN09_00362700 [Mycena chlorophos]
MSTEPDGSNIRGTVVGVIVVVTLFVLLACALIRRRRIIQGFQAHRAPYLLQLATRGRGERSGLPSWASGRRANPCPPQLEPEEEDRIPPPYEENDHDSETRSPPYSPPTLLPVAAPVPAHLRVG